MRIKGLTQVQVRAVHHLALLGGHGHSAALHLPEYGWTVHRTCTSARTTSVPEPHSRARDHELGPHCLFFQDAVFDICNILLWGQKLHWIHWMPLTAERKPAPCVGCIRSLAVPGATRGSGQCCCGAIVMQEVGVCCRV